ncbi:MAG: Hpt domain-containing protein [Candidatus Ornithospirochaeta sp.]
MLLKDCYTQMGGNYDEAIKRLMNEKLMERFLQKFLADPSFNELKEAMTLKDGERAFRGAHTLKGVSANLALTQLCYSSSLLTETLRNSNGAIPESACLLLNTVERDYNLVINTIKAYFA